MPGSGSSRQFLNTALLQAGIIWDHMTPSGDVSSPSSTDILHGAQSGSIAMSIVAKPRKMLEKPIIFCMSLSAPVS
eukprot:CAMPEP_0119057072 /NCGR_PEP_ID=MMETSP1178-20130426/1595_1 /TAXON_ID=33656 /ORGANISM="unid sp, Strain CCMP2000" /LENGTH=75 /DNA_ID=CAMNT_0007037869 /DNA_START=326 /DNA_END=553 /DNA_ORIENTATION=-